MLHREIATDRWYTPSAEAQIVLGLLSQADVGQHLRDHSVDSHYFLDEKVEFVPLTGCRRVEGVLAIQVGP